MFCERVILITLQNFHANAVKQFCFSYSILSYSKNNVNSFSIVILKNTPLPLSLPPPNSCFWAELVYNSASWNYFLKANSNLSLNVLSTFSHLSQFSSPCGFVEIIRFFTTAGTARLSAYITAIYAWVAPLTEFHPSWATILISYASVCFNI